MEIRLQNDVAFDVPVDGQDDGHYLPAPEHTLANSSLSPEAIVAQGDAQQDQHTRLQAAWQHLDARDQHILQSRWLAPKKATLKELAAHYGISIERVRQLEQNAISALKRLTEGYQS